MGLSEVLVALRPSSQLQLLGGKEGTTLPWTRMAQQC